MKDVPKNKLSHWILSSGFIVLISLPLLGSFFGWDFYEAQNENRVMATFPDLEETALSILPNKLEAYCNDHFGFRNTFIRRHRKLEEQWFNRVTSKAVKGSKPDWWFYGTGDSLDDYLGYRQFSPEELLQWERAIKTRLEYVTKNDIAYLFMIMPDKIMVYPECAPEAITPHRSITRFDQLRKHMLETADFSFVYPIDDLLKAKETEEVYHPGDTHWNDNGGYVGYCYLIEQLKTYFPSVTAVRKEDCTVRTSHRIADIAGTLTGKDVQVTVSQLIPPQYGSFVVKSNESLEGENWDANVRCPPSHHYNPAGTGTALIIHDSFYDQGMQYLLPASFEHTYFFFMYANTLEFVEAIERTNPDVVIEMRVERSLRRISEGPSRDLD